MDNCYRDYTVINSQPTIEALENIIQCFCDTFGLIETIDDMFWYGVFCKANNYANFEFDVADNYGFDIPSILTDVCVNINDKLEYIHKIMEKVMKKEINKPEWMKYIEMYACCNDFCQAPSTFLRIIPKEEKYANLADCLINFLYSPNLTITMVKEED